MNKGRIRIALVFPRTLPAGVRFLSTRKLSRLETARARRTGAKRFFLPLLPPPEQEEFFSEFSRFWDLATEGTAPDDPFWRNAVSSKMQEWDRSIGYFCQILFSLAKEKASPRLLFLAGGGEEARIVEALARRTGWDVEKTPSRAALSLDSLVREVARILSCVKAFSDLVRKKIFLRPPSPLPRRPDALFLSLFYRASIDRKGGFRDPFFGILPETLSRDGKRVAFLSDFLDTPSFRDLSPPGGGRPIVPASLLSWGDLFGIFARGLLQSRSFEKAPFLGVDLSNLLSLSFRGHRSGFNLFSEAFYLATKKLLRSSSAHKVFLLFEGNCFERSCIQAVREENPNARIIGYAHGVVYPLNLKLYRSPLEKARRPEPDALVTPGEDFSRRISTLYGAERIPGGVRSACALRDLPLAENAPTEGRKEFLIALDGVPTAGRLLDWISENEDLFREIPVAIRAHPNVPIRSILREMTHPFPRRFRISTRPLAEDLRGALCVLYRHTSLGAQALRNGIPAIHLSIDSPLQGDPLDAGLRGRGEAASRAELAAHISLHRHPPPEGTGKRPDEALSAFLVPPTPGLLAAFLKD